MPSASRAVAVPPVETISTPSAANARANSPSPALSETPSSARPIFTVPVSISGRLAIHARHALANRTQHLVRDGLRETRDVVDADHRLARAAPQDDLVADCGAGDVRQVYHGQIHAHRADHGRAPPANHHFT